MNTYRFNTHYPYVPWTHGQPLALSKAGLVQVLGGAAAIRTFEESSGGFYAIHLQLDRENHQVAVAEIESALAQFGYSVVQMEITEWATAAAEGALLGGGTGTAVGSATKTPAGILLGLVIGGLVGGVLGHLKQTITARYRADHLAPGYWQYMPLPIPLQQPGFGWSPQA